MKKSMGHLKKDRQAAIGAFRDSGLLPDDFDFEEKLKDWTLWSVVKGDKTIGMCMIHCKELHFAILPEYQGRWLTRGLLKEIAQLDFEYTAVPTDDEDKQFFVERMGFVPIETVGDDILYRLDSLTHG